MTRPALAQQSTRPADFLLSRLEAVEETGPGRRLARCPAHDDRQPSLSIREAEGGTLLVKCWAHREVAHVVGAVGLELHHLFPPRGDGGPPLRGGERWVPFDVLHAVSAEVTVAMVAAETRARGTPLEGADLDRLRQASVRLHAAAQEVA